MKKIFIDFCDFHPGFSKTDNFFARLLSRRYQVEICDKPNLLIYSHQGHSHRLHSCTRLFYTDESIQPDFSACDYALTSFRLPTERNHRLPCYAVTCDPESLIRGPEDPLELLAGKTRFCSFVVSNAHASKTKRRIDFFKKLSKYKKVDSAGRFMNNIGGPLSGHFNAKLDFLKSCKFNIAFENNSLNGYLTEKIVHAMQARCLPLYWGDPEVNLDFNPGSFLNLADFSSDEEMIERIMELDQDDSLMAPYLAQPYFHQNRVNQAYDREALLDFLDGVLFREITPVARHRSFFSPSRWQWTKQNRPYPPSTEIR